MKQITSLFIVLFSITRLPAASIVVPNASETVEGNSANIFPFGIQGTNSSMRYQQVYDASQFSQTPDGGWIVGLTFRVDATFGYSFGSTLRDIQINLSTTSKSPDSLSPIFSSNVGANDTVVFGRGQLLIGGLFSPGAAPQLFDIGITFNSPFFYNPAAGNLLLDVRNFQGHQGSSFENDPPPFDAQDLMNDSVSRIYADSVNATSATRVDSLGLVTRFAMNPIPEPSPLALLLLGAGIFGVFVRRRRTYQEQE